MYKNKFLDFIKKSKTPFHATNNLAKGFASNGYERLYESAKWDLKLGGKYYVCKNDSSILAFTIPNDLSDLSFKTVIYKL